MKYILGLSIALLFTITTLAQTDTSYWNSGGTLGFNGSQSTFTNWSQGGENQIAGTGSIKLFANFLKDKQAWDNLLMMDLGFSIQGNQASRKSDDRIEFNTKYGMKATDKWYYSALFNFKSQMLEGYDYPDAGPKTYISNLLAPAYFKLGLGMDYKPNNELSIFLSPLTAKWTLVNDQDLADDGKFGLDPAVRDTSGNIITEADNIRTEMGALFRLTYTKDIWTNVNLGTIVEMYSNYLKNPMNVDIDWQMVLTFKINNYLNAQIKTHLIYDDDVMIDVDRNDDGVMDGQGPRTQFNENLSLGLVYKL